MLCRAGHFSLFFRGGPGVVNHCDSCCCFFEHESVEMAEQERPSVRRRSSFGRALDRVKDVLKRRRSSAAAVATLQSTREDPNATTATVAEETAIEQPEGKAQQDQTVTDPKVAELRESNADSQLVPDDASDDDLQENEEPLTPLYTNRTGFTDEKAKALFERYGIKYQPRQPAPPSDVTSPSKIRRVERPVRIRIHWTCHECKRQFGHDRACLHCGHLRCSACTRAPPKKVKAILDEAKQTQMAEERSAVNKDQILAEISPNTVASPSATPGKVADQALELDVDDGEETDMTRYMLEQRPRSGIKLVMRSKAPNRIVCHECQAPFVSRSQEKCGSCGHQRCKLCTARQTGENAAPFEPQMVATVQRVYRKPRQRVRWTCDRCASILADSHRCRTCDHLRCESCIRTP